MNEIRHYGIKGQRWGVRRFQNDDGSLTTKGQNRYSNEKKVDKLASKDAQRFADAKMFYGKTAGTKRKLLKAELDKKKKTIPGYEDKFNNSLDNVDYAKSAKKAVAKRKKMDVTYRTRITTKQILGITGPLTVAAGSALYYANKQKVDAFVLSKINTVVYMLRK